MDHQPTFINRLKTSFSVILFSGTLLINSVLPSQALDVVYDPWNYQQNLLTAARELQNIQNQVRQLTNEANMLANMDQNLLKLDGSIAQDVQSNLTQIQRLMNQGRGLALRVTETEQTYQRLFPKDYQQSFNGNERLHQAKQRWELTRASFGRALNLQAQVSENVESDLLQLKNLMTKSQNARGALEVQQVGNELTSLKVKQAMQLQSLIAAQYRAESLNKARGVSEQEEARLRFKSFLGDGAAYSRQ